MIEYLREALTITWVKNEDQNAPAEIKLIQAKPEQVKENVPANKPQTKEESKGDQKVLKQENK